MDFQLFYHRPEEKFHRSSFDVSMSFGRLSLHLNSKQFSDLLDFFKFQNYSTLYGSSLSPLSTLPAAASSFRAERCRAYRDLYWKEVRQSDLLTAEERQRIEVRGRGTSVSARRHPQVVSDVGNEVGHVQPGLHPLLRPDGSEREREGGRREISSRR